MSSIARAATALKSLHVPGKPLVVANIWNLEALDVLVSLNAHPGLHPDNLVKAIATTSYAIAEDIGTTDDKLTFEQNLNACSPLGARANEVEIPLTLDLQDGYQDRIEECIKRAIELGAVGANIEDAIPGRGYASGIEKCLYSFEEAKSRISRAVTTAKTAGVDDFVINARTDVFRLDPPLEPEDALKEAIARGQAFLDAGATTVFVWGGFKRGLRDVEVKALVQGLNGRLAVKLGNGPDALTVRDLTDIGVARVSCGGGLAGKSMEAFKEKASKVLKGGTLA